MSRYACPHCGSEHTMSYETIYKNGVNEYEEDGTFDGYTEDFRSVSGSVSTRGTTVSNLAQSCAPPKKPDTLGIFTTIFYLPLFLLVSGGLLHALKTSDIEMFICLCLPEIMLSFFVIEGVKNTIKRFKGKTLEEEKDYYKALDKWRHSYVCMRCGHRFKCK